VNLENIEGRILRRLPEILLAGVVPAAAIALLAQEGLVRIMALAFIVGWALMLLPVAVGCLILWVMKGPPRTADSYPLPELRGLEAQRRRRQTSNDGFL
jgi:hypothetical protein